MAQALSFSASGLAYPHSAIAGLVRFGERLLAEYRFHQDLAALEALDERQLGDIGLGAGELEHAARFGRSRFRGAAAVKSDAIPDLMPASWTEWR